jgi:polyisoprenoid-binding protein YceI
MKSAMALSAILVVAAPVGWSAPVTYTMNRDHTDLTFAIDHAGFSMKRGWFTDLNGTLKLDPDQLETAAVDITVAASSIATNHELRDRELRGKAFLDVERFPNLRFVSTKVTRTGPDALDVQGDLTLHGVSKPLLLHVKVNRLAISPFTKLPAAGFSAEGALKRSDYGILTLIPLLGDEVKISIEAEFSAASAPPP